MRRSSKLMIAVAVVLCCLGSTAALQVPAVRVFYSQEADGTVVANTHIGTIDGEVFTQTAELNVRFADAETKAAYGKVRDHAKNLLVTAAAAIP